MADADTWVYERLVRFLDDMDTAGSCEDGERVLQTAVDDITAHFGRPGGGS